MGGGLRGGGFAGFGTAVMQDDFGGPDNPVVAFIIGVGISEVPRFHLFAVGLAQIVQKRFVNVGRAFLMRGEGDPHGVEAHVREKFQTHPEHFTG